MKLPISISGTTSTPATLSLSFHSAREMLMSTGPPGAMKMTSGWSVWSSFMEIEAPEINIRIFLSNLLHFSTSERLAYWSWILSLPLFGFVTQKKITSNEVSVMESRLLQLTDMKVPQLAHPLNQAERSQAVPLLHAPCASSPAPTRASSTVLPAKVWGLLSQCCSWWGTEPAFPPLQIGSESIAP